MLQHRKGWQANLELGFATNGEKTRLVHRRHNGPLIVQRPFYPEGNLCHVYFLHPPGGMVAGDHVAINVTVDGRAEALLTTPGAGKIYRSAGQRAEQQVRLQLAEDAVLEWLPQETIVYQGARLTSKIHISLADNTRFIGWEMLVLGRPASGEGFQQGEVELSWRLFHQQKPCFLEKINLDKNAFYARWGLNGLPCCGTLFAIPATINHLEAVRKIIGNTAEQGATLIDDLLICRARARQAHQLRHFFERVRATVRPEIVRRESYTPRIWAT